MPVQTSVAISIDAPLAHVFRVAASMDARALIQKYGPLPGIVDVAGHDAPWSAVSQRRTHTLSDNSSVNEELIEFERDTSFAYRVSNFTGAFASLVREARGDWHFTALGLAKTRIDWTYVFTATGAVAEPVLWFIVKLAWPGYLRAALERVKSAAEKDSHENRDL